MWCLEAGGREEPLGGGQGGSSWTGTVGGDRRKEKKACLFKLEGSANLHHSVLALRILSTLSCSPHLLLQAVLTCFAILSPPSPSHLHSGSSTLFSIIYSFMDNLLGILNHIHPLYPPGQLRHTLLSPLYQHCEIVPSACLLLESGPSRSRPQLGRTDKWASTDFNILTNNKMDQTASHTTCT